jgi:hypothetical protein
VTKLPRGRVLYRREDDAPFVILRHERSGAFHLSREGWTSTTLAAGPFEAKDVLRAWRLANVRIPEGCERGPWQWGSGFFALGTLPFAESEWAIFDPAWATPSVSHYETTDIDEVVNETCCAPPHDEPRVDWSASPMSDEELLALVGGPRDDVVGVLEREWNVHPKGSVVVASRAKLADRFAVVDLPPSA